MQREQVLTNGCIPKVQFLRFVNQSAVIHDDPLPVQISRSMGPI